ncbi:MAG: type II secretion system F family protein [Gemmatimonadaceae bacterium]|nr:type II secretion system F family protein [Gemmatimonadaceae bacterium]
MPRLRYRALTRGGAREAGTIDAATAGAATEALRARGLIVLDVRDHQDTSGRLAGRVRTGDLVEFTRALAALLPAGLPLVRALAVSRDIAPPSLHAALDDVHERVARGSTFADALGAQPRAFPPSYVGLVRAGERAGSLNSAIARLADAIESEQQFRARLVTAAIYPTLLAVVGGAAIVVLLLVVLPRFGALFASSGSALPRSTAIVLALSLSVRANAVLLGVAAALLGALVIWLAGARDAAAARSRIMLGTPLVSRFYREVLAARTARTIAILLGGGAPVIVALEDAARSLDDPAARDEVQRVRARVREGTSTATALAEGTLFPPVLARLIAAGEESGQLATFFSKAADLFEDRAKRSAARFVALAEPALIVAFGIVVGLIALALVQAIYGINLAPVRGGR